MKFTTAFLLTALPFLAAASPVARTPKGVSIPIAKRGSDASGGVANLTRLRGHLARIQSKYDRTLKQFEANTGIAHPNALYRGVNVAKRATGSDPLTDDSNVLWYGDISVGTPPVTYTIDFDTGSSDLFVPDVSCKDCGKHTRYDSSKSSTSKKLNKTFALGYGDGSTTNGTQYTDTVTVAGLTVKSQTLGSADTYSLSFANEVNDGLMGLAFPAISSYPATPFFNNLIKNKAVDAGQFGFYLASQGSTLYLGGTDKSAYTGDINWNPVTQQGYWQIDMDSINVAGKGTTSKLSAIIDSGTTLVIGDTANVKKFWAAVPGSKDASATAGQGFYTFPCNSKPQVSMTFGGKSYAISASNLNLGTVSTGSSDCVGSIVAGNEGFWIVGDAFMKNVYTVFDFDNTRVGFATLAKSS